MNRLMARFGQVLLHPAAVFAGIALGVYIGLYHRPLAQVLHNPSRLYLIFLQMCVLPIMIAAVIISVGRLMRSGRANAFILGVTGVFAGGMLLAAALGVGLGLIGRTGSDLGRDSKVLMGQEIASVEIARNAPGDPGEDAMPTGTGVSDFLYNMIPENVFKAVSEGRNLPVLFFCIIIGVALGSVRSSSSDVALAVADAVYEAMLKVIGWTIYALPFGLCFLFADQIAQIGTGIFVALIKLILYLYAGSLALLVLYFIVLRIRSGLSFGTIFRSIRQALVVGFGTSNGFASLPFALEGLHKQMGFEKDTVDLVIPLGTTLNPHGNAICFGMVAVFIAQLYEVSLSPAHLLTIIPLAALAGVVASSAPGLASVAMLALVLDPFQLPTLVAIILVSAINPVIDPILTVVNVAGNCASAAIMAGRPANVPGKGENTTAA
ncbi:MAG: hypothetical protein A2498_07415 [Lentisphaerae bacterium RIFOXYC12_FULL_60_16]|nr:MAG: hypothetical protein A2498_07415 [Lentisphaerae bacterium RIFOXYC12_FULL_60_16]